MKYQAKLNNLVHHKPFNTLLANSWHVTKKYNPERKSNTNSSISNMHKDWYQANEAAIAPSDFWFNMVEKPHKFIS
jgi:hypothetical protein